MTRKPTIIRAEVRYPWDEWFALKQFKLVRGQHYLCKTDGLIIQMRNAAKKRNKRVSVEVEATDKKETISVTVFRVRKAGA